MDSMNITDEAIAVIGMSCRFPGAPDLDGTEKKTAMITI